MSGPGWHDQSVSRTRRQSRSRGVFSIAFLLIPLAILLCAGDLAHAQYGYETLTVDSGLPENEVRGITQTPDGYLWIATFNGLVRFDGVHLTVFNRKTPGMEQISSALSCREPEAIFGLSASTMDWCATTTASSAAMESRRECRAPLSTR